MHSKLLNDGSDRTYALIFDTGDEPVRLITDFAARHNLHAARLSAIGALEHAVLGYFDWQKKDYERITIREQVEVLALIGDIAAGENGKPQLHAHIVLGKRDGTAHGGHLLEARVRPTLEVVVVESPSFLQRVHDRESGLALIRVR